MTYRPVQFRLRHIDSGTVQGYYPITVESSGYMLSVDLEEVSLLLSASEMDMLRYRLSAGYSHDAYLVSETFWLWVRKISEIRLEQLYEAEQNKFAQSRIAAIPL